MKYEMAVFIRDIIDEKVKKIKKYFSSIRGELQYEEKNILILAIKFKNLNLDFYLLQYFFNTYTNIINGDVIHNKLKEYIPFCDKDVAVILNKFLDSINPILKTNHIATMIDYSSAETDEIQSMIKHNPEMLYRTSLWKSRLSKYNIPPELKTKFFNLLKTLNKKEIK